MSETTKTQGVVLKSSYDLHFKPSFDPTDTHLSLISTLRLVVFYNNELYFLTIPEPLSNGFLQEDTPLANAIAPFKGGVTFHANGIIIHPSYAIYIEDMNSFIKKAYSSPSSVIRASSHKVNIIHNVLLHKQEKFL